MPRGHIGLLPVAREGGVGRADAPQLLHWGSNKYILLIQYLHTEYPNVQVNC